MARKTKAPVTFEDRLNEAHAAAAAATSVFESVIADLEQAAQTKHSIATDLGNEIDRLRRTIEFYEQLSDEAHDAAADHLTKAQNIRALIAN
jgi:hypothetical protein